MVHTRPKMMMIKLSKRERQKRQFICIQPQNLKQKRHGGTAKNLVMENDDHSDTDDAIGGYDPAVRRILAKAEKRGGKPLEPKRSELDPTDESTATASDDNPESNGFFSEPLKKGLASVRLTWFKPELQKTIKLWRINWRSWRYCKDHWRKKTHSKTKTSDYAFCPRKEKSSDKMCPVVVRGQSLEYKPWQSSDMSDILRSCPLSRMRHILGFQN